MILRDALTTVALGLGIGLPLGWMATRLLDSTLTQVSPHDPLAFVSAAGLTILVALVAAWPQAQSAAAITPREAPRVE